jgi:hypothetical protein
MLPAARRRLADALDRRPVVTKRRIFAKLSPAGAPMPKDASKLTCEEFQRQLSDLINSDADLEDHPHVKACPNCRQICRNSK